MTMQRLEIIFKLSMWLRRKKTVLNIFEKMDQFYRQF